MLKTLLLTTVIAAGGCQARAQGIVQFNTRVPSDGINAPVTIDCKPPTAQAYGTLENVASAYGGYVVGLVDAISFSVYGTTTFRTDSLNRIGYINAVDLDIGQGSKDVRMAIWRGPATASGYAAARATGVNFGESSVFSATGGVAPATPTALVGLVAFDFKSYPEPCPEPATVGLFMVGGLFLLSKRSIPSRSWHSKA